jgi:hypothetical protein
MVKIIKTFIVIFFSPLLLLFQTQHAVLERFESLFFLRNERSSLTSTSATGGIVTVYVLNLSGFG